MHHSITPEEAQLLIKRALRNPNSGIKRPLPADLLPQDPSLYYSTKEVAALTGRPNSILIHLMDNGGIRNRTGSELGIPGCNNNRYWFKSDVDANMDLFVPKTDARSQPQDIDLTTHTKNGEKRVYPLGHPGKGYYSRAEAAAILGVKLSSMTHCINRHNFTVVKRGILIDNSNSSRVIAFIPKKEVDAVAAKLAKE